MSPPADGRAGFIEKLFEGFTHGPHFEFLKDMVQKTTVFFVFVVIAVALNMLVRLLKMMDVSAVIVYGVEGLEYLIFGADMLWFVTYLVVSTFQMIKDVLRNPRGA